MLIDTWTTVQNFAGSFEDLSPAQINAMSFEAWAARTGRPGPAESAIAALDAAYPASPPIAPQAAPEAPQTAPQGIDLQSMTMEQYAAVRGSLGVGGREYGRGALDGGSTADWIAAARAKTGRTQYGQQNTQDAARPDAGKYLAANEPVAGRASYYR